MALKSNESSYMIWGALKSIRIVRLHNIKILKINLSKPDKQLSTAFITKTSHFHVLKKLSVYGKKSHVLLYC